MATRVNMDSFIVTLVVAWCRSRAKRPQSKEERRLCELLTDPTDADSVPFTESQHTLFRRPRAVTIQNTEDVGQVALWQKFARTLEDKQTLRFTKDQDALPEHINTIIEIVNDAYTLIYYSDVLRGRDDTLGTVVDLIRVLTLGAIDLMPHDRQYSMKRNHIRSMVDVYIAANEARVHNIATKSTKQLLFGDKIDKDTFGAFMYMLKHRSLGPFLLADLRKRQRAPFTPAVYKRVSEWMDSLLLS